MQQRRTTGFTLIELMIVVAIISVLAAIAYPSYQDSVRKGKRTDATGALLNIAQQLERCYTRFNRYDDTANCTVANSLTAGVGSAEGEYLIKQTSLAASAFVLEATPIATSGQIHDKKCISFTLSHTGAKGAKKDGDADNTDICW